MHFSRGLWLVASLLICGAAQGQTSSLVLGSSAGSVVFGNPVMLTATVTPSAATGKVTFYDGQAILGIRPVTAGQSVLTTALVPAGVRSFRAYYSGDGTHPAAASTSLTVTVNTRQSGFQSAPAIVTGIAPVFPTIGDFDGDGKSDLAIANQQSNNVTILLGKGDGSFGTGVSYNTGRNPTCVAVGDFNGDGKTDLAVTNSVDKTVSILAGNGDGTFQAAVNFNVGDGAQSLAVGDLNGDGKTDIAVADSNSDDIAVLLGKGDGTFQSATFLSVTASPYAVVIGDFNGDGKADLATANFLGGTTNTGNVSVLLGNSTPGSAAATFQTPVTYAADQGPVSLAAGDFNGDGKADLAIANLFSNDVSVLLGKGDGTFQSVVNYAVNRPQAIVLGDLNGDGKTDIVAVDLQGNAMNVLFGNSNGTFQAPVNYGIGLAAPEAAAIGDFNNDGRADLVFASSYASLVDVVLGLSPTTTATLVSSLNPSNYGASVTLTATVSPTSATGKVTFYDGAALLGVRYLASGSAAFNTGFLSSGSHTLRAYYGGDSAYSPSISPPLPQIVAASTAGALQVGTALPAGTNPRFVVSGDFNGDGKPDLAVANSSGGNVSVLLGSGGGTFQAAVNYTTGSGPISIAVADFDGDGRNDLVVANQTSNSISLLIGNGDGTFRTAVNFAAGISPVSVAAADFNGDGNADLAIANLGAATNNITVLLGKGNGTFQPAATYSAGAGAQFVATGDFNRDGIVDLAVANSIDGTVSILSGKGDGTFLAAASYAVDAGSRYVAVGDFNRDGKPDLAVADFGANNIALLLGNGDGTFQAAAKYPAGSGGNPASLAVEDFNGDGTPDVAVANQSGNVSLLAGKGDGTLGAAADFGGTPGPCSLVTADFNADGRPDLVWANGQNLGILLSTVPPATRTVLLSSSNPSVYSRSVTLTATVNPNTAGKVSFYDGTTLLGTAPTVNGVASFTASQLPSGTRTLKAYFEGSSGGLASMSSPLLQSITTLPQAGFFGPVLYPTGVSSRDVAVGDFNGDGKSDLAVVNAGSNSLSVLLNNGRGVFQSAVNYSTGSSPQGVATGDFNADGNTDLAVVNNADNNVSILLGNGDGTFRASGSFRVGTGPQYLAAGDFNGDGIADLAVACFSGFVVLLGNGDGTFQPGLTYPTPSYGTYITVGDFNGDGKADLAIAYGSAKAVGVLLGNGNGSFQAGVNYSVGTNPSSLAPGDFNEDGYTDIAVANTSDNTVSVLLGTGNGTFQRATTYAAGISPASVTAADFNGDGRLDLAIVNTDPFNTSNGNTVTILAGKGDGSFLAAANYGSVTQPAAVISGDFNGDGRTDLAVVTSSAVAILRGKAPAGTLGAVVTLTSSLNPSTVGQNITLTATLSPASISGTVTFYDGIAVLGTAVLGNGAASLNTSGLSTGARSLRAIYSGDAAHGSNTSAAIVQTVRPAASGGLGTGVSYPAGTSPTSAVVADFNGDGKTDLAVANSSGMVNVMLGNGDGSFGTAASYPAGMDATGLVTGDFNLDGRTDLIASTGQGLFLLSGNGDGTFQGALRIGYADSPPVAGDFNGDGIPDLAYGGSAVTILLGIGDGTFTSAARYSAGDSPTNLTIGDFNGDRFADIAVTNPNSGTVTVLLGVGDGTFSAPVSFPAGYSPTTLAAGDFNGDGKLDLAVSFVQGIPYVNVLLGKGDGTFGNAAPYALAGYAWSSTAADLNGDGWTDLVIGTDIYGGTGSPMVSLYLTNSTGALTYLNLVGVNSRPLALATADFNGDGRLDLVTVNSSTNDVTIFLGLPPRSAQTITFGQLSDEPFGAAPLTLTATASSGLPVSFISSTTGVCTVTGSTLTAIAAGTCSISASQAGNATFAAAPAVVRSFNVTQAAQTITFGPIADLTLPAAPFALTATASSGLTVSFTSSTTAVCTVTPLGTLTPVQGGTCTLLATQPGNANYSAAVAVSQSFHIAAASSGGSPSGGGGSPSNGGGGSTSSGGGGGGTSSGGGSPGGAGGGSPLVVLPTELAFDLPANTAPVTRSVTLSLQTMTQGAPAFASNATTNVGFGWLSATPASGTMDQISYAGFLYTYRASVNVTVNPAGLSAGTTYAGNVNVSGGGGVATVPVTLNISAKPAQFSVAPQALTFTYSQGDTNVPAVQSISVFSQPSGLGFSATSNAGWLSIGASGTAASPASIPVSVDVSQLAPGTFTNKVRIASGTAAAIDVPVTITVTKAAPQLSVSSQAKTFSLAQGSAAVTGQVVIANSGGGAAQYSAQAASDQGGWLKLMGPGSGSASASAPSAVSFTVDPSGLNTGFYTGRVLINDRNSAAQFTIPVLLSVSNASPSLELSQSGILFTAVAGGSPPPSQSFNVLNAGTGTLHWTAQAQVISSPLSSAKWLSVSGNTVTANAKGLAAGQYYGSLNISSPDAGNSPQAITVLLNVLPAQSSPGVTVSTGGLILTGIAGSKIPVQQSVALFNPGTSGMDYATSAFTANGTNWLSVSSATGTAVPGTSSLQVTADLSSLSAGVQTGTVRLSFADGSFASIQVVAVVTGSSAATAGSLQLSKGLLHRSLAIPSTCVAGKPTFLVPILMQPLEQSTAQVAAPKTVRARIVDDCGAPLTATNGGSVQVSFNSPDAAHDSPLDLHDTGSGVWEGTWTPVNASKLVTVQLTASEHPPGGTASLASLVITGSTAAVSVQAAGAGAAPQPTGIINAASGGQGTPQVVTPGSYVAIYGTGLAGNGSPSATSLPLPFTLNGTQLFLGGKPMPLVYAGPGQVNALIPVGLAPNTTYPLIVVRGATQSVPVPLTVVPMQPGIYTLDLSGSGQGIVEIAGTATLAAPQGSVSRPAVSGADYLVIFCTGLGAVSGPHGETGPNDGAAAPSDVIFHAVADVSVTIGGVQVPVVFAGLTPSLAGLYQVNVQLPAGLPTGGAVPMVMTTRDPQTGAAMQSNVVGVAIR